MKKLVSAILFSLPLLAAAQQNYTLQATIPALPNGEQVFLMHAIGTKMFRDSAIVNNGTLVFKGSIPEPSKAVLRTEKEGKITGIIHFYLEPADLKMKSADSLQNAAVTNSVLNKEAISYGKAAMPYFQQIFAIKTKASKMSKDSLAGETGNEMRKQIKAFGDTLRMLQAQFIKAHPASFISLELLRSYAGIYIDVHEIKPMFEKLSKKIQATSTGVAFAQALTKAEVIQTGNRAPQFVTATPAGDSLSLKQVLAQSKWVLVDFWASWCKPCRAENPNVVKAYQEFHDKGFNIISISLDKSAALWKAAIEKDNMPWYHGSSLKGPDDTTAVLYTVGAIPDNFLLDANGVIIARGLRGTELAEKLTALAAGKK